MRTLKQILILLLVLLVGGHIASYFYLGSSEKNVAPVISCPPGVLDVSASDNGSVLLQGITATDAQDGDITHRISIAGISKLISNNTAKVNFLVFDSDDNMASCTRLIRYADYHRPTFSLSRPLIFTTNEDFSILDRVEATDVVDGDLSSSIRISTQEPTEDPKLFYVSLQVTNSVGDTSLLRLPVLQLAADEPRPEITLTDYLVYVDQGSAFLPESYLKDLDVPGSNISVDDVQIHGEVNTAEPGTYYVHYTSDVSIGTVILTVVVE